MAYRQVASDAQIENGVRNACDLKGHAAPHPCADCQAKIERFKASRDEQRERESA